MNYLPSIVTIIAGATTVLVITWLWRAVRWVWFRPKSVERQLRQQGLSGKPYRFLFGDLKDIVRMSAEANSRPISLSENIEHRVFPFNYHTIQTYGKNSFMWFGPRPVIFVTDPHHMKEVFTRMVDFLRPPLNPLEKLLVQGLFVQEGEKWTMHRRILNPAFHMEKLKLMLPAFYSSTNEMVGRWAEAVSSKGSYEVDVWPDLQQLTCDVISRTAFGSSFEEGRKISKLQQEQAELFIKFIRMVYIPGWHFIPTKMNRRMKSIEKEVQSLLRGMIQRRLMAMQMGEPSASDDLLGILLKSNADEIREKQSDRSSNKWGLSISEVVEECKLFFFAGQETTSTLLVWTMFLLSIHPDWQHRAREEVFQVFGDRIPDAASLSHLKIVTMIFHEVMRLYPPAAELRRKVEKETTLGNLSIPAEVLLILPIMSLHRDPEVWGKDAEEFRPERFAEGVSKATKANQIAYFPFGWAPRICIGQNFALIEAKIALAMILQRFSFELSPTYTHAPVSVITLKPQHGLQLILRKN